MARALAAATVLAAILVGSPLLLVTISGPPLPHGLPSGAQIRDVLTRADDGTLFLGVLRLITWAAWAAFAAAVLTELIAQLRGRQAPHLPGLGALQRLSAWLIASILIGLGAGAPAAIAAPAHAATPASTPARTAITQQAVPAATKPATSSAAPHAAASATTASTAAAKPRGQTVVVKRGDTLWDIAVAKYRHGLRYKTIYQANRGKPQPRGLPRLTNPNLIFPGQRLVVPLSAHGHPPNHATGQHPRAGSPALAPQHPTHPSTGAGPAPQQPAPGATATPHTSTTPGTSTAPHPPASAPAAAPTTTQAPAGQAPGTQAPTGQPAPAARPTAVRPHDSATSLTAVAGYSALAAAALVGLLGFKRLIQQRRRRPGHRIAMPAQMSPAEFELRSTAEPASVDLLDTALRSLSSQMGTAGTVLPALRGARVAATTIELLLTEPAEPAPPFTAPPPAPGEAPGDTQPKTARRWLLQRDSADLLDGDHARAVPAPYPALVTLGFDSTGAHLLVDLETIGAIALTGDDGDITEVLTAIALELGTSPWADHIIVTCVGFAPGLPRLLGTGRIRHTTVDEALAELEAAAHDARDVLTQADLTSPRHARSCQIADDAWTPHILLAAAALTPAETNRLTALVTAEPSPGLAAVIAAAGSAQHTWVQLDTAPHQAVPLDHLGTELTLQRVTAEQYDQLLADLAIASDDRSHPDPAWQNVLPEPTAESTAQPAAEPASVGHAPTTPAPLAPVPPTPADPPTDEPGHAGPLVQARTGPGLVTPWSTPAPPPAQAAPTGLHEALLTWAEEVITTTGMSSAQALSAQLQIGTPSAERILDELELCGVVGPEVDGDREVLRGPAACPPAGTSSTPAEAASPAMAVPGARPTATEPGLAEPSTDSEDADADEIVRLDPNAPDIRVLGRVEIGGRDLAYVEAGKRNLLPELAAYLHFNPRRGADELSRALGGARGPWSNSTRASNMSRLRSWLGRDPHGRTYVPTQGQGQLYTITGVRSDWDRFQAAAKRGLGRLKAGDRDRAITDLQTALSLVRGQPFAGANPAAYIWAEHLKQEMISTIVDIVHTLAIALTDAGQPHAARTAIAKGMDIEPGSELLFRDLVRAEHRAGNIAGIDQATQRLLIVLHELGVEMEPETAELLEQLRPHRRRTS